MSDDLIRRRDAIETAYQLRHKPADEEWGWWLSSFKAIPSADRPQGEWTNAGVLTVHCSNCKSEFHELEAMNFCPNCGAKML